MNEIIKRESVETIVSIAPGAYNNNKLSHDRCLAAGDALLLRVQQHGMSDELDKEIASYIDKSRKTVKKLLDARTPVTKLFDEIRTVFTTLENEVDPSKPNSIAAKLQISRNQFAQKKREEEEERRKAEEHAKRVEAAKVSYRADVETTLRNKFQSFLNAKFYEITELNKNVTIQNYEIQKRAISSVQVELLDSDIQTIALSLSTIYSPLTIEVREEISRPLLSEIAPQFKEQFNFEMLSNRDAILELLPSKKKELEAIANADEEEAKKREAALKQREHEEAMRREEERIKKEAEDRLKAEIKQQQADMGALFTESAAAAPVYHPKVSVKKKIEITDTRGFLDIVNLWWVNEGAGMSIEELTKKFKSQITFCEKLANDKGNPITIPSQYIKYTDEIKAK